MTLNLSILLFVLLGSVVIAGVSILTARGFWQRIMLLGVFSGLLLYSGIGAAYTEVSTSYLIYYFGFLLAVAIGFCFFRVALIGVSVYSGRTLTRVLNSVDYHPGWLMIIWIYLLLHLILLVYPEFRLHHLLVPPSPDLTTAFAKRFVEQEMNVVLKLLDYARLLLAPFFYIALFRYRKQMKCVILLLVILLYIQYVEGGYIGRGTVVMTLALIGLSLWVLRPRYRPSLIIGVALLVPIILCVSYVYGVVRIGGTVDEFNPISGAITIIEKETSFPRNVGMPIIEAGERVSLTDYAKWVITLPIPKVLTGSIEGARINYEISEIVLGVGPGEKGWYVVLPGLVAESVYIYGPYFFWLHGVFVAFPAALVVRLMERTPQLLFLQAYVVLLFAYVLNRGGIAALLPVVTNEFMLFYLYVFVLVFRLIPKHCNAVQNNNPASVNQ